MLYGATKSIETIFASMSLNLVWIFCIERLLLKCFSIYLKLAISKTTIIRMCSFKQSFSESNASLFLFLKIFIDLIVKPLFVTHVM